jgi:hypothetical protein
MTSLDGAVSEHQIPSSAQRDVLANALRSFVGDEDGELHQRRAIREICRTAAHQPQMREHLLVSFRALLITAANQAQIPPGPQRNALFGRLATMFIEEFYSIKLRNADGKGGNDGDGADSGLD